MRFTKLLPFFQQHVWFQLAAVQPLCWCHLGEGGSGVSFLCFIQLFLIVFQFVLFNIVFVGGWWLVWVGDVY